MTIYIGLDVHSKHSTFEIQDADGKILGTGEVPTGPVGFSELKSKYKVPDGTACALETGTVAFYCARQLAALKLKPVVVDAAEVRNKASRRTQKSDRRDAHEICEGLRRNIYYSIVHVPTPEISAMRNTLSRRRHFVRTQTREVNAVKCLLRSAGYGSRYKSLKTETAWNELLDGLSDETTLCIYLNQHFAAWRCAGEHIAALEVMLRQQSSPCKKDLGHLQTILGVGPVVSTTTVAVLAEPKRFPSAKHAASYAGLVPSTFQSGARDVHGHITKKGSGELRAMLCEAAQHASNPKHPLSPYFARILAKKGYKAAIIAVAHRLLRIMYAMLRDGTDFDETKLNVEKKPSTNAKGKTYVLRKRVATVATC